MDKYETIPSETTEYLWKNTKCKECLQRISETKTLTDQVLYLNNSIENLKRELELVSSLPDNNYVAMISENKWIIKQILISNKMKGALWDESLEIELNKLNLEEYINWAKSIPWELIHTNTCIHKLYINILYNEKTWFFNLYFVPSKRHKSFFIDKINDVFDTMLAMADQRDPETWEHLQRLSVLSWLLSEKLGKDEDFVENMRFVAPLHDIWKVWISDSILLKKWKLDEDEFEIMKTHTTKWDKLLANLEKKYWKQDVISFARNVTLYHHEKYDWSGYPEWLSWEEIPIEARILAIIDVFDALKSKRPYKEAFSDEKTIQIIKEWRWTHFDPHIVDIFLENWNELLEIRNMNEDKN